MAFRGTSTLHVRLMLSLANELGSADLEALKGLCKSEQYGGFGAGQLQKITTISELLNKLQAKRIFKEGDYTKLKELLVMIDNEEAKQNVEEAEKNFQSLGTSSSSATSQQPNTQPENSSRPRSSTLDSQVIRDDLYELSKLVGSDWKNLARALKLEESTMQYFEADFKHQEEIVIQMLIKWSTLNGQSATYRVLANALKKTGRADLGDTLINKVQD